MNAQTNNASHTPGPWLVKGDQLYGADGTQIYVRNLGVTIPHYPHAVADANTKLMQTAPVLLEACLRVLRSTHFSIDNANNRSPEAVNIRNQLEAAIAKATGKTP